MEFTWDSTYLRVMGFFHPAVSGHKRNRGGDGIQQATALRIFDKEI